MKRWLILFACLLGLPAVAHAGDAHTVTSPAVIMRSASRREATPARERTLAMRSPSVAEGAGFGVVGALGVLVMLLAAFDYVPVFLAQSLECSIYILNKIG